MPRVTKIESVVIYYEVRASRENARRVCTLIMDKFPEAIETCEIKTYSHRYTSIKVKFWDYKNLDRHVKNIRKFIESINLNDIQHVNPRYIPARMY